MGFTLPSFWRAATPPETGVLNEQRALDATATLELEGAQAPQSKTIASGSISPTTAYVIVDTEGSAAADDLTAISPVLSASENLHDGMVIYLKAADSGRVVTVKNSTSANGINTYDGNDYVLSTTHWLKLQLRSGKWYEVEGRAMEKALAATTAADHAQTKSGTSSTASGTAAKVVTCSGFELSTNARIFVTFNNANTVADAITLNVNGTGAKSVYNQTGIISTSNTALFAANQPIEFRYDGTGWVFFDPAKNIVSGTTLSATCATASGTADKVATCAGFSLTTHSRVLVSFSNANTVSGALTLNVNGTGAKSIYNENGAVSSSNPAFFKAGKAVEFVYDATNDHWMYRYADVVRPVPSGTTITLTTPANNTSSTAAPADGVFTLYASGGSTDASVYMSVSGPAVGSRANTGVISPAVASRAEKGQAAYVSYAPASGPTYTLTFTYDKGAI